MIRAGSPCLRRSIGPGISPSYAQTSVSDSSLPSRCFRPGLATMRYSFALPARPGRAIKAAPALVSRNALRETDKSVNMAFATTAVGQIPDLGEIPAIEATVADEHLAKAAIDM